ncbi:zeta toxin family protein [Microbacterium sp. p3-SID337]|nr:zeta toxin family protein [Microbacterium sp. p3-SID131]MCT1375318.1 zeta toxin family protein [Microbacterium sp. p3-SID337]
MILETTMRQLGVVDATIRAFRDSGYRVEVRALAVSGAVSLLGAVSRFLGGLSSSSSLPASSTTSR